MRIISIDDSKSVHAFINHCFDGSGHELVHAMDGRAGIQMILEQGKKPFDLILLDWEMPEMTGPDVVRALKAKNIETPIIMLTTKNKVDEISSMLDLGVREYVMKPFTKEILLEKVQSIF